MRIAVTESQFIHKDQDGLREAILDFNRNFGIKKDKSNFL